MKTLFSRKPEDQAAPPRQPKEKTGLSIARLNLIAMVVAMLAVLVSGYAAYLQFASQVSASQESLHTAQAREKAALLSGRLLAMGDELERLARADAPLLAAIARENSAYLRRREQQLAQVFPAALRIRYILPSEKDPNDSLAPRLSYACLDLARRAEKGTVPPFEVHLPGSEQQHIDIVRPVFQGDTPVASLMVTLDVVSLKSWLGSLEPPKGYVIIQQGTGGDAVILAAIGNAAAKGHHQGYLAGISGSNWQLRYWPSNGLGMAEARQGGFLLTFAVAAVILLVFFVLFNRFLSHLLRNELKRMVGFIVDSSLGKRFQSYPVKLAESKQVLKEKEMDLSVLSSHARVAESARRDHDHDEIPELTFSENLGKPVKDVEEEKGETGADSSAAKK